MVVSEPERGRHMDGQKLDDTKAVAERVGVPEQTVIAWRKKKTGPPYAKFGKHVRYRRADVDSWIASKFTGTADPS